MRKRSTLVLAALMLASLLVSATAIADDGAQLTVVHGIPGATVDVYVDGANALPGFAPNTVTDPIPLPAGTYQIDIYMASTGPETAAPA